MAFTLNFATPADEQRAVTAFCARDGYADHVVNPTFNPDKPTDPATNPATIPNPQTRHEFTRHSIMDDIRSQIRAYERSIVATPADPVLT